MIRIFGVLFAATLAVTPAFAQNIPISIQVLKLSGAVAVCPAPNPFGQRLNIRPAQDPQIAADMTVPFVAAARRAECFVSMRFLYSVNDQVPAAHRNANAFWALANRSSRLELDPGAVGANALDGAARFQQGIRLSRNNQNPSAINLQIPYAALFSRAPIQVVTFFNVPIRIGDQPYVYHGGRNRVTMEAGTVPEPAPGLVVDLLEIVRGNIRCADNRYRMAPAVGNRVDFPPPQLEERPGCRLNLNIMHKEGVVAHEFSNPDKLQRCFEADANAVAIFRRIDGGGPVRIPRGGQGDLLFAAGRHGGILSVSALLPQIPRPPEELEIRITCPPAGGRPGLIYQSRFLIGF